MGIESEITKEIKAHYKSHISDNDQLHIGGLGAVKYLAEKMRLKPDQSLLDLGCGLGGPARYFANAYDMDVTGVDLSPDFIECAKNIDTIRSVSFIEGGVHDLPFENETFHNAACIHVGMNIVDKAAMYIEAARVLKRNAQFAIYDVMALDKVSEMRFAVPWAETPHTSFLATPDDVQRDLRAAGFEVSYVEDCRDFAISSLTQALPLTPESKKTARENLLNNIKNNCCAPFIIIAEKRS